MIMIITFSSTSTIIMKPTYHSKGSLDGSLSASNCCLYNDPIHRPQDQVADKQYHQVDNFPLYHFLFPRYESGRFTYMSLGSGLGQILRTEGLTGLYRGLGPTLIRCNNYIWSQIFK